MSLFVFVVTLLERCRAMTFAVQLCLKWLWSQVGRCVFGSLGGCGGSNIVNKHHHAKNYIIPWFSMLTKTRESAPKSERYLRSLARAADDSCDDIKMDLMCY